MQKLSVSGLPHPGRKSVDLACASYGPLALEALVARRFLMSIAWPTFQIIVQLLANFSFLQPPQPFGKRSWRLTCLRALQRRPNLFFASRLLGETLQQTNHLQDDLAAIHDMHCLKRGRACGCELRLSTCPTPCCPILSHMAQQKATSTTSR